MNPYLAELVVAERGRELAAEAARARLVALAICCRPSVRDRATVRVRLAWARLTQAGGTTCCAVA